MVNADLSNVNGWKKLPLKDIVDIKTGKKDANEGDENGIYRFYTCAKDYSFIKDYEFNEEAILISGNGAYVGYVHYFNGKFDAYQRTYILSNFSVDVFFLYHYLGEKLSFQIHREKQDGATPYITKGTLAKFKIEYPENTKEQTAIATILSKVDEAIEATRQSIKAAEKLKKALMQNLLTGKLKPDGTWRKDDEFYEDEKFGKVPVGWEVKKVKDCFDFYPTSSYSRSKLIKQGEIGYIHYGDIHTKFDRILDLAKDNLPFIPKELMKKYENLKDGDIVVSDASEDWVGVGKCVEIINVEERRIISGLHTLHLRPKSDDFILGIKGYIFNIYQVATNIKSLATGMKVYGISKPNLGRVLLPIPTEQEQKLIKKQLDFCSNDIQSKQTKIQTLQRLKKSLMQNLLTGKVRLDVEEVNKIISEQ